MIEEQLGVGSGVSAAAMIREIAALETSLPKDVVKFATAAKHFDRLVDFHKRLMANKNPPSLIDINKPLHIFVMMDFNYRVLASCRFKPMVPGIPMARGMWDASRVHAMPIV